MWTFCLVDFTFLSSPKGVSHIVVQIYDIMVMDHLTVLWGPATTCLPLQSMGVLYTNPSVFRYIINSNVATAQLFCLFHSIPSGLTSWVGLTEQWQSHIQLFTLRIHYYQEFIYILLYIINFWYCIKYLPSSVTQFGTMAATERSWPQSIIRTSWTEHISKCHALYELNMWDSHFCDLCYLTFTSVQTLLYKLNCVPNTTLQQITYIYIRCNNQYQL